jgi:hypothetical protein
LLPKLGTDWPIPLGVARGSKAMAALRADAHDDDIYTQAYNS